MHEQVAILKQLCLSFYLGTSVKRNTNWKVIIENDLSTSLKACDPDQSQTVIEVDEKTVDIFCPSYDYVQRFQLHMKGAFRVCTIYISGGKYNEKKLYFPKSRCLSSNISHKIHNILSDWFDYIKLNNSEVLNIYDFIITASVETNFALHDTSFISLEIFTPPPPYILC